MPFKMNPVAQNPTTPRTSSPLAVLVLGLGLAVIANLSMVWGHGSEKHGTPDRPGRAEKPALKSLLWYEKRGFSNAAGRLRSSACPRR